MTLPELETRITAFYRHKQKYILFTLAVALVIVAAADALFFHTSAQDYFHGFDLLMVVLFLIFVTLAVGVHVGEAVFHVAAGFTLVIFLAESYCAVPFRSATADDAFRALLAVGVLYIIFDFAYTLYRGLHRFAKRMEHLPFDAYKAAVLVVFLGLVCIFAWAVYAAMDPIIAHLCVYR
jgi:hypothetical protein